MILEKDLLYLYFLSQTFRQDSLSRLLTLPLFSVERKGVWLKESWWPLYGVIY